MKKLSISVLLLSIVLSIALSSYVLPRRFLDRDQTLLFYDMKKHIESGKVIPTTGARFEGTPVKRGEYNTPRIPGGAFYIFYITFYKLAGDNLFIAKIINLIFSMSIAFVFLFWVYKKFGLFVVSIFSPMLLLNGYFFMAVTSFWNPNLSLIFSLIFFILFFEYSYEKNRRITILSAVSLFPVLAIMGQGHFATFFSMIPTFIIYLLIDFRRTKKYLLYFAVGIFISFLMYVPYIVSEFQNNFQNLKLILDKKNTITAFPFPQVHALFIFPTNEMSVFLGTRGYSAMHFWISKPAYIYGLIFTIITLCFSFFCAIRCYVLLLKKSITIQSGDIRLNKAIKETIKLYVLFIPATIFGFLITRSSPGTFRYLYSVFALSFMPIILFFVQNMGKIISNKKIFYFVYIVIVLNMIAVTGQIIRHVKMFEEPRSFNVMKEIAEFFKNETNGEAVKVVAHYSGDLAYTYTDMFDVYFPEYNINTTEPATLYYTIRDNLLSINWEPKRRERDEKNLTNASIVTNIGAHTIFKFNEGYRE